MLEMNKKNKELHFDRKNVHVLHFESEISMKDFQIVRRRSDFCRR